MIKKGLMVSAIALMFAFTLAPALADFDANANVVVNDNGAAVGNIVISEANTGENMALGSYAGEGGRGGDIENGRMMRPHGDDLEIQSDNNNEGGEVEDSTTGNGGAGGNSGIGGTVYTGDATAEAGAANVVNSNLTEIEGCPCEDGVVREDDDEDGHRLSIDANMVFNRNRALAGNFVEAEAETGDNFADGSYAGEGGRGGDIENSGEEVDDSATGNGARGGDSADGGLTQTGVAVSRAGAINIVNTNITRLSRAEAAAEMPE